MKNMIQELKFENINFDGVTVNEYKGKAFTAKNKQAGFGSGKKTVGTFTINGAIYENIAIDRLKSLLGDHSGKTATRTPATITGYCSKILELFEEGSARRKEVKKACDNLLKLEARYKEEDAAAAAEEDALNYLNGLSEDALAALLAKVTKK